MIRVDSLETGRWLFVECDLFIADVSCGGRKPEMLVKIRTARGQAVSPLQIIPSWYEPT